MLRAGSNGGAGPCGEGSHQDRTGGATNQNYQFTYTRSKGGLTKRFGILESKLGVCWRQWRMDREQMGYDKCTVYAIRNVHLRSVLNESRCSQGSILVASIRYIRLDPLSISRMS